MRNNTCETQGWVLGHTEVSALQTMSSADLGLQRSLCAGFWHCHFQQRQNDSTGINVKTCVAAAPGYSDAFGQQEMNCRRCQQGWSHAAHRAVLMLAQVRMCPVRFSLITSEWCLEGAAPSSSCSPKKVLSESRCGGLLFSYLLFFLRPSEAG